MTARACAPEPPCDCWMVTRCSRLALPVPGEGGVEILIQLARRVVRDVQQLTAPDARLTALSAAAAAARRSAATEQQRTSQMIRHRIAKSVPASSQIRISQTLAPSPCSECQLHAKQNDVLRRRGPARSPSNIRPLVIQVVLEDRRRVPVDADGERLALWLAPAAAKSAAISSSSTSSCASTARRSEARPTCRRRIEAHCAGA